MALGLCLSLLILINLGVVCLNHEMDRAMNTLCEQARKREALGDMCLELCEVETVVPVQCQAGHQGKDVVFEASFRDIEVFVKGRTADLENDSAGVVFWTDDDGEVNYPDMKQFQMMVETHLRMNMNLSIEGNTFYKLWPTILNRESFSEEQNKVLLRNSMKNIWTLILDNEYVFSRLFQHFDVFPELFGSCGGLYVVEKMKPLNMPHYLQRVNYQGWVERVKVGLAILDLVEELENMFDHPLHLCDIKSEHFGLSVHGRVKYLDVDSVFLKPVVDKTVGDGTECENHEDCDLFDCKGQCDLLTKKCRGSVVNNNLQVICEKILLGGDLLGGRGLLVSKHASKGVQQALQKCANPSNSKDKVRVGAGREIFKKLYETLREAVTMQHIISKSDS